MIKDSLSVSQWLIKDSMVVQFPTLQLGSGQSPQGLGHPGYFYSLVRRWAKFIIALYSLPCPGSRLLGKFASG